MQITARAYAKINWSLNILSAREDGYHELDMLMQRIDLHDTLVFDPAPSVSLSINGRFIREPGKNLVYKAAFALSELLKKKRGANIRMTKRIPVRAGLGGGSADCAVTLMALNRLWGLNMPREPLIQVANTLGSDVLFCMEGIFARVTGTGDVLTHLQGARRLPVALIMPYTGLSTREVFTLYDQGGYRSDRLCDNGALASAIISGDFKLARGISHNSLEAPALELLPEIKSYIDQLYLNGAVYAHMTGSGSCVYGVFETDEAALRAIAAIGRGELTHTRA